MADLLSHGVGKASCYDRLVLLTEKQSVSAAIKLSELMSRTNEDTTPEEETDDVRLFPRTLCIFKKLRNQWNQFHILVSKLRGKSCGVTMRLKYSKFCVTA